MRKNQTEESVLSEMRAILRSQCSAVTMHHHVVIMSSVYTVDGALRYALRYDYKKRIL